MYKHRLNPDRKPMNLFDAVPFIAQMEFEGSYDDVNDYSSFEIHAAVRDLYFLIGEDYEFPADQDRKNWRTYVRMITNAADLVVGDVQEYNKYCRVDTEQLNKEHNLGFQILSNTPKSTLINLPFGGLGVDFFYVLNHPVFSYVY